MPRTAFVLPSTPVAHNYKQIYEWPGLPAGTYCYLYESDESYMIVKKAEEDAREKRQYIPKPFDVRFLKKNLINMHYDGDDEQWIAIK